MITSPARAVPSGQRFTSLTGKAMAAVITVAMLLGAGNLSAAASVVPHATLGYVNNSNVFDLPDGIVHVGTTESGRADSYLLYGAGLDSDITFSRQRLFVNAQARRTDYRRFNELSHNEYLIDSGLVWKLLSAVDGKLGYRYERRMVPFTDLNVVSNRNESRLLLETERDYTGAINLSVTPVWRLEASGQRRILDSPRPASAFNPSASPNLQLRESTYIEGLKYVGIAKLSMGLEAEQVRGRFNDYAGGTNPDYTQNTYRLAAAYKATDLTTFNLEAGQTKRDQPGAENVSAFTGMLGYSRKITGKTEVSLQVIRAVDSYLSNANSEINTGARLGAEWAVTGKTSLGVRQEWRRSEFPGQRSTDGTESRQDGHRISTLEIRYLPLRWLQVRPYWRYEVRTSNVDIFPFKGTIVGIEFTASRD